MKVGDFGFGLCTSPTQKLTTFCGSIFYAAPELLSGESFYYGVYVDIWAFGVLLYYMLVGQLPFNADTPRAVKQKILRGVYEVPEHMSAELAALLALILKQSPSERPTMAHVRQSDWLSDQQFPRGFDDERASEVEVLHTMRHMGIPEEDTRQFRYYLRNPVGGTYAS